MGQQIKDIKEYRKLERLSSRYTTLFHLCISVEERSLIKNKPVAFLKQTKATRCDSWSIYSAVIVYYTSRVLNSYATVVYLEMAPRPRPTNIENVTFVSMHKRSYILVVYETIYSQTSWTISLTWQLCLFSCFCRLSVCLVLLSKLTTLVNSLIIVSCAVLLSQTDIIILFLDLSLKTILKEDRTGMQFSH